MNSKFKIQNSKLKITTALLLTLVLSVISSLHLVKAQTAGTPTTNINSSEFRLIVCDGPKIPDSAKNLIPDNREEFKAKYGHYPPYVACDFKGIMMQVQHFLNIAIVLGVVVAIALFTYAGYLYIKGGKGDIDQAHDIFPKVFWGFIIMLSAWFIVYQLLAWLTGSNVFSVLLGTP